MSKSLQGISGHVNLAKAVFCSSPVLTGPDTFSQLYVYSLYFLRRAPYFSLTVKQGQCRSLPAVECQVYFTALNSGSWNGIEVKQLERAAPASGV